VSNTFPAEPGDDFGIEFYTEGLAFERYTQLPREVRCEVYCNAPVYVLGDDEIMLNPVHDMGAQLEEWFMPGLQVEFARP
jgi:hypothetical protein